MVIHRARVMGGKATINQSGKVLEPLDEVFDEVQLGGD